jgi:hypothetical protein
MIFFYFPYIKFFLLSVFELVPQLFVYGAFDILEMITEVNMCWLE